MIVKTKILFLLPFILAPLSCSLETDDTFAREFIEILRRGDLNRATRLLSTEISQNDLSWLGEVCTLLTQGEVKSFNAIGSNFYKTADRSRTAFTYELEYPTEWILVEVVVDEVNGGRAIVGIHTYRSKSSWIEVNNFSFRGKSIGHLLMFVSTVSAAVFSVIALVLCIRTRTPKKWAWILFIILGLGKISINWTTGLIDYQIIATQLLSASAFTGGLYPQWILSASLPIGAIVFLLKRRSLSEVRQIRLFEPQSMDSTKLGA